MCVSVVLHSGVGGRRARRGQLLRHRTKLLGGMEDPGEVNGLCGGLCGGALFAFCGFAGGRRLAARLCARL
jgi:hypothetical protein